jgi:hypothetical protein
MLRYRLGCPLKSIFLSNGYHLPLHPEPTEFALSTPLISIPMINLQNIILPKRLIRLVHCFISECASQTHGGLTNVEFTMGITMNIGIGEDRQPCDIYLSEGHMTSLGHRDMMEILIDTGQKIGIITIYMHAGCLTKHLYGPSYSSDYQGQCPHPDAPWCVTR